MYILEYMFSVTIVINILTCMCKDTYLKEDILIVGPTFHIYVQGIDISHMIIHMKCCSYYYIHIHVLLTSLYSSLDSLSFWSCKEVSIH